jgi:pyrroloquinoline quinone biosynthesis protein B
MIIRVLGSGAGGGFPQWNCNCGNCAAVRAGDPHLQPRLQTAIAVSADGEKWAVLDASPDLRGQIAATPRLQPSARDARRSSPIKAVVVTGFEIDQVGGLLNLREGQAFGLYATPFVLTCLRVNPIFGTLAQSTVSRHAIECGRPFQPFAEAGMDIVHFAVPGTIPQHDAAWRERQGDETVGLLIRDVRTGRRAAYIPSCAALTHDLISAIDGVDVLLFDGTLFTDHELVEQGLSKKTGAAMGHISMSGPVGAVEILRPAVIQRRIFVHLNNSNPVLRDDSLERTWVSDAGWEVAHDGMEIAL